MAWRQTLSQWWVTRGDTEGCQEGLSQMPWVRTCEMRRNSAGVFLALHSVECCCHFSFKVLNGICQIELLWWLPCRDHLSKSLQRSFSVHHDIFCFWKADVGTSAQGRSSPWTPEMLQRFPRLNSPAISPLLPPPRLPWGCAQGSCLFPVPGLPHPEMEGASILSVEDGLPLALPQGTLFWEASVCPPALSRASVAPFLLLSHLCSSAAF